MHTSDVFECIRRKDISRIKVILYLSIAEADLNEILKSASIFMDLNLFSWCKAFVI